MIKIIDHAAGNAASVDLALRCLGRTAEKAYGPDDLKNATHIILPGVGSAAAVMLALREMNLVKALKRQVIKQKKYFLGIASGLEVLFEDRDYDRADSLGWLSGGLNEYNPGRVKVPQIGWNRVRFIQTTPCCAAINAATGAAATASREEYFYFSNSRYAIPSKDTDLWAVAKYGGVFTAAVRRGNIYATQFRIEKSGPAGLTLLESFLNLKYEEAENET